MTIVHFSVVSESTSEDSAKEDTVLTKSCCSVEKEAFLAAVPMLAVTDTVEVCDLSVDRESAVLDFRPTFTSNSYFELELEPPCTQIAG